ncbi:MAG: ADP-dependent glucokinase/phosphofructokinase [Candidatus Micrarchaeia archaeon]
MELPKRAVFAFNANIDHLKAVGDGDMGLIDAASFSLASQMSGSFAEGRQKETLIDAKTCAALLSKIRFDCSVVGGQAGNATEQASALGVECFLHSNFANSELLSRFSKRKRILLAGKDGFVPAGEFSSQAPSAHHFVFEDKESRTRFIASYDPLPMHLEENFQRAADSILPSASKAFVGGFHLLKTPDRLAKFTDEILRWKRISPGLCVFAELGEFQSEAVRDAVRERLFPIVDMIGLNDTELSSFGCDLSELAQEANTVLFHMPERQEVLPAGKLDREAMAFAEKCASFKAENGRCATLPELESHEARFLESPKWTVGLGDTFSCAYFMAASASVLKQNPSNEALLRP